VVSRKGIETDGGLQATYRTTSTVERYPDAGSTGECYELTKPIGPL